MASAAHVDFDVMIAGGGPAGSAAARELSGAGWRVAVVDRGRRRPVPARAETLPGAAVPLLERLGVADAMDNGSHLPALARRSHWGAEVPRERPAVLDPYGEGRHIDRPQFDAVLRAGAQAAGARWMADAVRAVRPVDQSWFEVTLGGEAGGGPLRARGIIDATGRSSRVARSLGARLLHLNRMVAACATAAPAAATENTGLVEAAADGWWYSAPIANGGYAVQFVTLPQLWSGDRSLSDRLRSSAGTASRIDPATVTAPTLSVCGSSRLDRCAGPGWVAAGDAAAAHDPLAAAGLTMALRSGLRAAQALAGWLRSGRPDELDTYDEMQRAAFESYLRERSAIYSLERRWPASPFWAQPDPLALSNDG
jgi:flavin-dependent dehydrogenase